VADGTYTESTLKITTTAPRDTLPIWSIEKLTYSGSNLTQIQWAQGSTGAGFICANRTTLQYQ
jgi:hypothetical protein